MNRYLASAAVLLAVTSFGALAHTGHGGHGFADGLAHPFFGLDHLLVMLVVGAWGVLGSRRVWLAPACFVVLLALGALLGQQGLIVPEIEPLLAVSVLVLGLMLAHPAQLSAAASLTLIGAFALLHGAAHGAELASGSGVLGGIVLGSALLHGAGMGFACYVLKTRPRLANWSGRCIALLGGGLVLSNFLA